MKNTGFTLIEIILSLAVILIISGASYVAFGNFNKQQVFNSSYENLKNTINEAKSDALSQVISKCTGLQTLVGYQIAIDSSSDPKSYSLQEVCQVSSTEVEVVNNLKTTSLPPDTTITSDFSSSSPLRFLVLTGKVSMAGTITLSNGSQTRTININSQGVMQSEESH